MKRILLISIVVLSGCASTQTRTLRPEPISEVMKESARKAGAAAQKGDHPQTRQVRQKTRSTVSKEIHAELSALRTHLKQARSAQTNSADTHQTEAALHSESPEHLVAKNITSARPEPRDTSNARAITTNAAMSARSIPTTIVEDKPTRTQVSARVPVLVTPEFQTGDIATDANAEVTVIAAEPLKHLKTFESRDVQISATPNTPLIFELPVTYNDRVKSWLLFFQNQGRHSFRRWLERSARFLPYIQSELEAAGMPQDLIYVAMIESGFSPTAVSPAHAVGMWQFIRPTANRYGMRTTWWLDERRDVRKSTKAALAYMRDLYKMFGSWYLVAASYNMGENGVKRLIKRHGSNDFWELADKGALPEETKNYVPKILAAMLIAKAPGLYGFRDLQYHRPHSYEYSQVPGGTKLVNLAAYLGVSGKYLQELNPELIQGHVPPEIPGHRIRIPKGSTTVVSQYVQMLDNGYRDSNLN